MLEVVCFGEVSARYNSVLYRVLAKSIFMCYASGENISEHANRGIRENSIEKRSGQMAGVRLRHE